MGSIAKAMKVALEATGYSELRDYQRKTIEAYLSGRDVFVYAPTGAGKSLTFELAPYTFDRLFGEDCDAIVLVIVPLISLMNDQVSDLNSRGIRASYAAFLDDWRFSLTPWSFLTKVSFLSAQLRHKILVKNSCKKQSLEISFPSIDSRLKQIFVFVFFPAAWGRQLSHKVNKFVPLMMEIQETHTRSRDLVGVESAHSAIEVRDSQMKPETPNANHATPHFWREM